MARPRLTAVPATRSSLPLLTIRRRLVLGTFGLCAATGLFSGVAWMTAEPPPAPVAAQSDQGAAALARTVVEDYLAARASSVPAAKDVDLDFSKDALPTSDSLPSPTPSPGSSGAEDGAAPAAWSVQSLSYAGSSSFELGDGTGQVRSTVQERFTLAASGALYEVTVPLVTTGAPECAKADSAGQRPQSCWVVAATPSLTAATAAGSGDRSGIDYEELFDGGGKDSVLPTPAYREQIVKWASVFAAAGKADRDLLGLTGDDQNHTYSGLGGWKVVQEPVVRSAVPVSTPHPGFIVRVGLVLAPPASNGPTLRTDYDLYIRSDKSQTVPPVVAWGAAGSYKSLQPYLNADQR